MTKTESIKYLIINIFYFPLFYIFSYIIPKDKDLILLGSSFGKHFSGNPKYYYLYLIKNHKSNFYWLTSDKKILADLKNKNYPVLYFFSIKAFFYIVRARLLIIDNAARDITYIVFLGGRFNIIQTWHGIPIKNISDAATKSYFDKLFHYLCQGERMLYKNILSCSNYDGAIVASAMSNKNIRKIGYPRDDIFFNKDLSFVDYKQKLNLGAYNKILLYAPTFRDGQKLFTPFSEEFLFQFNNYLGKNNYILLIKNHPLFGNKFKISSLNNILDISNIIDDIQEILLHTDILITDYGSVFFDFSLLKKPIIFYVYDYKNYTEKCRHLYLDYLSDLPGPIAKNETEFFDLIKNSDIWSSSEEYYKKYQYFNNKFHHYQDGKSCERLYNLINNL